MTADRTMHPLKRGVTYLAEGGQETEVMYKHGFDLPHFAMFVLIDDPRAMEVVSDMYRRYLDVAARHGFGAILGGLDYRASPDWAALLGLSNGALADIQRRCTEFLRDVSQPYAEHLPDIVITGVLGPRGDAYQLNRDITADEAEEYHGVQMATLRAVGVDMAHAMTFNNVAEAIGVSRAAASNDLPLCVSFTVDETAHLQSGPSLRQAIAAVDEAAGDARPTFYGINCSHPSEFAPALEPGDWISRIASIRPNAAQMEKVALCQLGHLESGDPVELGRQLGEIAERYPHINVWGGCCGTWDDHLDSIAASVAAVRNKDSSATDRGPPSAH